MAGSPLVHLRPPLDSQLSQSALASTFIVRDPVLPVISILTKNLPDVNQAADQRNLMVVGGSSWSVGAAGGWILGAGHSSLSPQYGLGVDSKFDVAARHLISNPS
jgi:hypothetical protein